MREWPPRWFFRLMSDDFPTDVRQFIGQNIESLAQLESLLLLRRDSQQVWSAATLAKVLYITPEVAAALLLDLARRGVAVPTEEGFRYQCKSAEVDRIIALLAKLYEDRRVAVISAIYSRPLNKVQTFADAFRLRKED
jgi:hypothetical protein